ncbi:class F sortase [Geodermatophilus sp. DF01-2]|uniref:class F sortase n=1 Tax=Geodermatophilus sp. DF01-2 TaxID=2559610 RepID=UPI0010733B88|nr:class F sortase [Geodermatophilus sp. DF01_2]TFV52761.1 class F sortase [Geodermatophilus sp. DF01_2]
MSRAPDRPFPARSWAVLSVLLAVVGVVALVVAVTGQQSPPQPAADGRASAPTAATAPTTPPAGSPAAGAAPPVVIEPPGPEVAEPVTLRIPSLDVTSELLRLGLNDDGTVEVPPLGPNDQAGWYHNSPRPGAVGPSVLLGHVDSAEWGPGVFFELGALTPGDEVEVTRADGSVAVFAVDRVERYPKDEFPTLEVYGNTTDPQLRLITCGGAFDPAARSYEDNVVAYATMVDTRPA